MDKRERAEPLHRRALEILTLVHGPEHPDITSAVFNLVGTIYAKKPKEAEQLARKSVEVCRRLLGDEHADTAWARYNLAYVLINGQEYREAERYLREALAGRGASLPDKPPVVGSLLLLLGRALMAQGELKGARSAFEECLSLRQSTLPHGHWLLATTSTFLGECLVHSGETERGFTMMSENCDALVQRLGRGHEQTGLALERLAKLRRWVRTSSA